MLDHHKQIFKGDDARSDIRDATYTEIQGFPPNANQKNITEIVRELKGFSTSEREISRSQLQQKSFQRPPVNIFGMLRSMDSGDSRKNAPDVGASPSIKTIRVQEPPTATEDEDESVIKSDDDEVAQKIPIVLKASQPKKQIEKIQIYRPVKAPQAVLQSYMKQAVMGQKSKIKSNSSSQALKLI